MNNWAIVIRMKTLNVAGYSANEEIANTYTHALGIVLSLAGLVYLLFIAFTSNSISLGLSYTIYGL